MYYRLQTFKVASMLLSIHVVKVRKKSFKRLQLDVSHVQESYGIEELAES